MPLKVWTYLFKVGGKTNIPKLIDQAMMNPAFCLRKPTPVTGGGDETINILIIFVATLWSDIKYIGYW